MVKVGSGVSGILCVITLIRLTSHLSSSEGISLVKKTVLCLMIISLTNITIISSCVVQVVVYWITVLVGY